MRKHALLAPSAASRWLACTRSARLEEQFPESSSLYADEGTLAHDIGELMVRHKLGLISSQQFADKMEVRRAHKLFAPEMEDYCDQYAGFVIETFNTAKAGTRDAKLFLESELNLSDYVPESFGTSDANIVADGTLAVIDLKYGKGVPVSAENNKQMMLYALGVLRDFDYLYDIQRVKMVIYQPRIDNISEWLIDVNALTEWAETQLKPLAAKAFAGEGDFVPGDHCRFCKAKVRCKALADFNLELAKLDFEEPLLLSDAEISEVLAKIEGLVSWAEAVKDFALDQAVNHGKKWDGFKLVEGRSNRKYTDQAKVAQILRIQGFQEEVIYSKELLGITSMEKLLGKNLFQSLVAPHLVKPPGKPALVPVTDKRPEFSSVASAAADFAEVQ